MGAVQLLHQVLRLVAEHRSALEQAAPILRLAEEYAKGDADVNAYREAIVAELRVLSDHHSRLFGMVTTIGKLIGDAKPAKPATPAPPMDRRGD